MVTAPPLRQVQNAPLYDYGKLYKSADTYWVVYPRTLAEVQHIVTTARQDGTPLRVRASGHSFSGATLPRPNELLLRMHHLDHYRFEAPGTITVGAGALLWDVRDFVSTYGLQLPVYNGGWGGPTVGGFICSGGMGCWRWGETRGTDRSAIDAHTPCLSETYGGFWENVCSVTLVDGRGDVREFTTTDEEFKWLFGSFGQLGVLVEARLKLLPVHANGAQAYPLGQAGTIPKVQPEDPKMTDAPPPFFGMHWLYWFSILVSPAQEQAVWEALQPLVAKHAPYLQLHGGFVGPHVGGTPIGYRYVIRFKNFTPPMLYPFDEEFLVLGFMAVFGAGTPRRNEKIFEVEKEFVEIALRQNFTLYPQAENLGLRVDFQHYYNKEIYNKFENFKESFDPEHLLNRGVFFPTDIGKPMKAAAAKLLA
jgi:FAD binding domain-containing protein